MNLNYNRDSLPSVISDLFTYGPEEGITHRSGRTPPLFQPVPALWERDKCMSNPDSSCPNGLV